jgi:uncharacterized membrane protein YfcA
MRDRLLLIFAGSICALLAWVVWHYLYNDAFSLLLTITLIFMAVDNVRLRRQLRSNTSRTSDT